LNDSNARRPGHHAALAGRRRDRADHDHAPRLDISRGKPDLPGPRMPGQTHGSEAPTGADRALLARCDVEGDDGRRLAFAPKILDRGDLPAVGREPDAREEGALARSAEHLPDRELELVVSNDSEPPAVRSPVASPGVLDDLAWRSAGERHFGERRRR